MTRDITGDTDLRLCKFFGLSEGYFLRLQNAYDTKGRRSRGPSPAQLGSLLHFSLMVGPGKASQREGELE
jgi:plasmid maintenance system antidote protein VapI